VTAPDDLAAAIRDCPFHRLIDIRLVGRDDGAQRLRLGLSLRPELMRSEGPGATLHGGVIATLIDVAAVYALRMATGGEVMTVGLSVDYLRPVAGPFVEAEAQVIRAGRRMGWVEARLYDGALLAATGRASFVLVGAA
jgi:uncharacterized protein (TIGR00369 family)